MCDENNKKIVQLTSGYQRKCLFDAKVPKLVQTGRVFPPIRKISNNISVLLQFNSECDETEP